MKTKDEIWDECYPKCSTLRETWRMAMEEYANQFKKGWTREEVIELMSKSFDRGVSRQLFDQTWIESNLLP